LVTILEINRDKSDNYKTVEVRGHSGYGERGRDIVCSAISAVVITSVNFLKLNYGENFEIFMEKDKVIINCKRSNHESQLCIKFMIFQLTSLAKKFPKNIILKEKSFN
jgi:uncharacterized protein YsxB (DUF464 family)